MPQILPEPRAQEPVPDPFAPLTGPVFAADDQQDLASPGGGIPGRRWPTTIGTCRWIGRRSPVARSNFAAAPLPIRCASLAPLGRRPTRTVDTTRIAARSSRGTAATAGGARLPPTRSTLSPSTALTTTLGGSRGVSGITRS